MSADMNQHFLIIKSNWMIHYRIPDVSHFVGIWYF